MHLGHADVAALSQAATLKRLGVRAFHAGSRGVLLLEFLCLLLLSSGLERLVVFARLEPDDARLPFGACTLRPEGTGAAILARESRLPLHAILRIGTGQPRHALLARWTGHYFPLPIHLKLALVETFGRASLPARILRDRPHDLDAILLFAVHERFGIRVALIDQVLGRQQIALLE